MIVIDTGIGIAQADQQRIFEPFERVKESQTQRISGTGLGLSISRLLVEMLGGSLELTSQLGNGSEFCLKLFLPAVSGALPVSRNQADIQGYVGRTQHIMVVDDESSHRHFIHDFLHPLGFVVHQAECAEQALQKLKTQSIDLFLLDISMPGMDGWQLLAELRNGGFKAPVIILSADSYEDAKLYQKNADFQAYISKPVRLDKLLEQLQRCLDLHWYNAEAIPAVTNDTAENNDSNKNTSLDQKTIIALREFAKIGYLKGVLESTEELESQAPKKQWLKQLRLLVDKCDLDGIVSMIDELIKLKGKID